MKEHAFVKNKKRNDGKTAVLLVNTGTPENPSVFAVARFLSEFLNDPLVINLPWLLRKILVNCIIVPFRSYKSSKRYKKLWNNKDFPLRIHGNKVRNLLQEKLKGNEKVFFAMRYGKPSLSFVLKEIKEERFSNIVVLPMFPQYSSSTTGSIDKFVRKNLKKWKVQPKLKIIRQFYDNPLFIQTICQRIKEYQPEKYDIIIFSYHGLPIKYIEKIHPEVSVSECTCQKSMPPYGSFCYRATCFDTTRKIMKYLGDKTLKYKITFQSHMSKNWLHPYTDKTIINLAEQGVKKVLIVSPSFVADCLETEVEIAMEYSSLFKQHGGEKLQLVESLNEHPIWIETLCKIIR